MGRHERVKRYKAAMKKLTERYLRTQSREELESIVAEMEKNRDEMIEAVGD